jgi:putative ABC transport system permease protein
MFIALRDLWFAKGRFALMGAVVCLLALLMVLLTGLSTGLVDDNIGGVRALPANQIAFSAEAGVKWNNSVVDQTQWDAFAKTPGVNASAPVGNKLFNGQAYRDRTEAEHARDEIVASGKPTTKGTAVDLALFGVEPRSFVAPRPVTGEPIGGNPNGVVVSDALVKKGVAIGDTIVLDRVGTELTVVGVSDKANYGHVPIVYAPLRLWQEATYGPPGGPTAAAPLPESVYRLATVIAADVAPGTDLSSVSQQLGLKTVSKNESFNGSPGYAEETGTLTMIKCFLYLIGAVLVGAFFTVWTIQRKSEIALVKALGASNRYVLTDAMGQAAIVLVLATGLGVLLGRLFGFAIPNGAPFSFDPLAVGLAGLFVVLLGLAGAALSTRRITKVDPLTALGSAR